MSVNIVTYTGRTRTAQHDAMTYDASLGQSGIFYGCGVTAQGNALTIGDGFGIIKGRVFQIEEETINVTLASSGSQSKMLVLTLDLSNSETPLALSVQSSDYTLTQDADANFDAGIYQVKLATFTITTVEITDIVETAQLVSMMSEKDMYYMPGNTETIYLYGGGYLTSGKTSITTFASLCKPVHSSVSSVSLVSASGNTVTVRQNGSYLADGVNPSTLNARFTKRPNGIQINLTKSSGFGGTNNDSVGINMIATIKFN